MTLNNEMPYLDSLKVCLSNNTSLGGYNVELCYVNFFYAIITFIGALVSFLVQKRYSSNRIFKKKIIKVNNLGQHVVQGKIYLNSGAETPVYKLS